MLGASDCGGVRVPKRSTFVPVLSTMNFVKFHLIFSVLPLCACGRCAHDWSVSEGEACCTVHVSLET